MRFLGYCGPNISILNIFVKFSCHLLIINFEIRRKTELSKMRKNAITQKT